MNNKVFADTLYWVAVLNPKDQWHRQAVETRKLLGEIKLITTETVLIEVLNYFRNMAHWLEDPPLTRFGR